jgi:hypothetical protein
MLLKPGTGHILPFSLAPPLNKVSQVEIEAGDCEGRLPLLFLALRRAVSAAWLSALVDAVAAALGSIRTRFELG